MAGSEVLLGRTGQSWQKSRISQGVIISGYFDPFLRNPDGVIFFEGNGNRFLLG